MYVMVSLFREYEIRKLKKEYLKVGNYFIWDHDKWAKNNYELTSLIFRIESIDDDYMSYTYPNSYLPQVSYCQTIEKFFKKAEPFRL